MNKGIIAVLILAILALVGFWFFVINDQEADTTQIEPVTNTTPSETNNDDEEEHESKNVEASYDGSKFTPNEIKIQHGSTITFVNNSQKAMWVASDVHPTHEELAEFDAKRGVEPGETYSFTFEQPGTWGFHDHLNPTAVGVVVVEE
jgi:plastocyanin